MTQDDELLAEQAQAVRQMFERIPFNQALGIELDEISTSRVVMHLPMKPELVGNFVHGILHGGGIASLLDVAGGAPSTCVSITCGQAAARASLPAPCCCARATRSQWCARSCITKPVCW